MDPKTYQEIQAAYLAIREFNAEQRKDRLEELQNRAPEISRAVHQLLESESRNRGFLDCPLIQRDPNSETLELKPEPAVTDEIPQQIGPYRILQQIGEGGHGVVYMAEQLKPIRRRVAIKWVKPGMDSKTILARFEAERQALAMMNHPSIANVLDADTTESGRPYFVMELVHGTAIDQFCTENGLPLTDRLELFQQVCDAVHHAHRKGVIHRDIKPANVLVTVDSGKPLAKVIDFGIAKALHLPLTESTMYTEYGQIVGTLEYMSPEQSLMSQSGVDVRSDVYSLGVMLYLLITGETPLSKKKLLEKGIWELKNVLQNSRPETPSLRITSQTSPRLWRDHSTSPLNWLNRVKGDLDWVTMKALAKEPERRYDSAAEFSQDITHFLAGDSVAARPPTTWYKLTKFLKRNRTGASIAAALAVASVLSFAALTWGYLQSQHSLAVVQDANRLVLQKAKALELERKRADENARRMAKMLERNILETAWEASMDGDRETTKATLADIVEPRRQFAWHFVDTIARQMELDLLRNETEGAVRKLASHSARGRIAAITNDSMLEIWNVVENVKESSLALPTQIYTALAFSSSGDSILAGGSGDTLLLVDLVAGQVRSTCTLGKGGIRSIVHDDQHDRWLITTGANYVCSIDDGSLEEIAAIKLDNRISRASLAPAGENVVVTALDGTLFVLTTNKLELTQTLIGGGSEVLAFQWLSNRLLVCDRAGHYYSLPFSTKAERVFETPFPNPTKPIVDRAYQIEFADADLVFVASHDGLVGCYRADLKKFVSLRQFSSAVNHMEFLEETNELLVAFANGRFSLMSANELRRGRAMADLTSGLQDAIALSKNNIAITGHADGHLKRWDSKTGALLQSSPIHSAEVFELDAHQGTNMLASVGSDQQLVLSQISDLKIIYKRKCQWGVRCVAFSPDGTVLAGAPDASNPNDAREGTVDLWDVTTGNVRVRLTGHTNWVTHIRFCSTGQRIITLSVDGTVRIWSTKNGACLHTIELSFAPSARALTVSHSGKIFVGHEDGSLSVWELDSGQPVQSRHVSNDSIVGLYAPKNSKCLVAAIRSQSELLLLDATTLSVLSRFDAGVGYLRDIRVDNQSNLLQFIGESGSVRLWEMPR